jgi:hypothetical protein
MLCNTTMDRSKAWVSGAMSDTPYLSDRFRLFEDDKLLLGISITVSLELCNHPNIGKDMVILIIEILNQRIMYPVKNKIDVSKISSLGSWRGQNSYSLYAHIIVT